MDRQELEANLAEGVSLAAIARRRGLDPSTVRKAAKRLGVIVPDAPRWAPKPIPADELRRAVDAGGTQRELASRFGVSPTTIQKHLRRHGLQTIRRRTPPAALADRQSRPYETPKTCRRHGRTRFQLDARGYYRCLECRAEAVIRRRRKLKQILVEEAGGACVLCGYSRCSRALHFHHRDPEEKAFALSGQGYTRGIAALRAEARKCVLLCSNCHSEVEDGVASISSETGDAIPYSCSAG